MNISEDLLIVSLNSIVAGLGILYLCAVLFIEGLEKWIPEDAPWLLLAEIFTVALSAGTYYAVTKLYIPAPRLSALWFSMWTAVWCAGVACIGTVFYFVVPLLPRHVQLEGVFVGVFSLMSIASAVFFFLWVVKLYGITVFIP